MWQIYSHVAILVTLANIFKEVMTQYVTNPFQLTDINIIILKDTINILP